EKTFGLLDIILQFHEESEKVLKREVPLSRISELPVREQVARLKEEPNEGFKAKKEALVENFKQILGGLQAK
ncbi:MAG: hypothetical protein RLZZ303_3520, partial [Candidatus Hydrogenedentota bacterium]